MRAADAGNGGAAITAGFMFARGQGIAEDSARAVTYLEKGVADKEDAGALKLLGDLCADTASPSYDLVKARAFYERAIAQKNSTAALALGGLSLRSGSQKDFAEAGRRYLEALALGNYRASRMLGDLYYAADNPQRDVATAAEYYREAAKNGDGKAILALGRIYGRKEIPADGVEELISLLSTLLGGPDQGEALKRLGDLYAMDGPSQDLKPARSLCRAGDLGDGWASWHSEISFAREQSPTPIQMPHRHMDERRQRRVSRVPMSVWETSPGRRGCGADPQSINYYT